MENCSHTQCSYCRRNRIRSFCGASVKKTLDFSRFVSWCGKLANTYIRASFKCRLIINNGDATIFAKIRIGIFKHVATGFHQSTTDISQGTTQTQASNASPREARRIGEGQSAKSSMAIQSSQDLLHVPEAYALRINGKNYCSSQELHSSGLKFVESNVVCC